MVIEFDIYSLESGSCIRASGLDREILVSTLLSDIWGGMLKKTRLDAKCKGPKLTVGDGGTFNEQTCRQTKASARTQDKTGHGEQWQAARSQPATVTWTHLAAQS